MPFAFVLNAIASRILHFETKVFNRELRNARPAPAWRARYSTR
jgi:hypothetical protein